MNITEIELGKHYLVDEPEGNTNKSEVIIKEYNKKSDMYYIEFVKDKETIPIPGFAVRTMNFHLLD